LTCWYALLPNAPILILFIILQTLNIVQYLINNRLDNLKNVTWFLKEESNLKVAERFKSKPKNGTSTISMLQNQRKSLELRRFSDESSTSSGGALTRENSFESKPLSNKTRNIDNNLLELDDIELSNQFTLTTNQTMSMDFNEEDVIEMRNILILIKITRFFASNYFKFIVLFLSYSVKLLFN
jgi:hypothetical protein